MRGYLDSKAGHLHPQAVSKGLQTSLRDAVGGHVEAGEEREDAGSKEHPACSTYQRVRGGGEEEEGGKNGGWGRGERQKEWKENCEVKATSPFYMKMT